MVESEADQMSPSSPSVEASGVLIAHSNEDAADALATLRTMNGFHVTVAYNGFHAARMAEG